MAPNPPSLPAVSCVDGGSPMLYADIVAHRDALQRTVHALQRSVTDADLRRDEALAEVARLKAQLAACRKAPSTVRFEFHGASPLELREFAAWIEAMDADHAAGTLTYTACIPF